MAHTYCYKKHWMWDGDGKPCVWIFRIAFIKEYMKMHPDFLLEDNELYDCTEDYPDEDFDGWYCDECGCLAIFYSDYRVDYEPIDPFIYSFDEIEKWDDYIGCRDKEFQEFQEFYEGMNPLDAIEQFRFLLRYKLSEDGNLLFGYNENKEIVLGFQKKRTIHFENDKEVNR